MRIPVIGKVTTRPAVQTIRVFWADGEHSDHDLSRPIAKGGVFAPLRDPQVFRQAEVINDGRGIGWPGTEADCCADALWYEAHPDKCPYPTVVMTTGDFRAWLDRNGLTLDRGALALGLSRRQMAYYAAGKKPVPRLVALAAAGYDARSLHAS